MGIGLSFQRSAIAAMLTVCITAGAGVGASAASDSEQQDLGPIVQTTQGRVQGLTKGGLAEFFGIPYAAPPVGNLRWRPPVVHAPWTGILKATAFGPTCAQIENSPFSGPTSTSEDCLYINIYAPVGAAHKKLPVILWSYGGGDFEGESNDYDGSKLALQGTPSLSPSIIVSIFSAFWLIRRLTMKVIYSAITASSIINLRCAGCMTISRPLAAMRQI